MNYIVRETVAQLLREVDIRKAAGESARSTQTLRPDKSRSVDNRRRLCLSGLRAMPGETEILRFA